MFQRFATFLRIRPFSRTNREWWAGVTETALSAAILLVGVVLLVLSVTLAVMLSTPDELYISVGLFCLQILVATVLIALGAYRIVWLLLKVGVSAERRDAIVSQASEIELLNEFRRQREDLPTIPQDRYGLHRGHQLPYRLTPSPRNIWGLLTATFFSVGFVTVATILISTAVASMRKEHVDWLATGLALPIVLAAAWSIYQFFRQLLKLTGIGSTSLELSGYPLKPGHLYHGYISQFGRVRLRLLDVTLQCVEEATFFEGTDIRTERRMVFEQRLFRQRGITLSPGEPFQHGFEFQIPDAAMHSFQSANQRIRWSILVMAQAKQWPRLRRTFEITVHPNFVSDNISPVARQPK